MRKFYSRDTIDMLMMKISFENVLQEYSYPVKGSGKTRGSNCPKCGKNEEHFKINTVRNLAHCFVCKWKGNPIQFIQEVDNLNFIRAVEKYAEIGQINIEPQDKEPVDRKAEILYQTALYYSNFSNDYLLQRGISKEVIKERMIGYAQGGKSLKDHLNSLSFSDEELLEIGLIRERKNEILMDFFFKCVIIPVFYNGKVVDLYGRYVLEGRIKHLYLFGEHIAYNLDKIDCRYPVVIVESLINSLTLLTHKNVNVIAVGGSSKFTMRHARQLKAKKIKCCYIGYDTGDISNSGQKGSISTGKLLDEVDIQSYVLEMPPAVDINELYLNFKNAHDKMKQIIRDALPAREFEARFVLDNLSIAWIQNYLMNRQERERQNSFSRA